MRNKSEGCMLQDEFNRLMEIFHSGAEGRQVNLQELFAQSLAFFEHLKGEMQTAGPEDKQEILRMMAEMYKQIMEEKKKICDKSGLSEEQLLAFADNPSNFSKEQWDALQQSKKLINKAGQELVKTISVVHVSDKSPLKAKESKPASPKTSTHKKPKRSDWKPS